MRRTHALFSSGVLVTKKPYGVEIVLNRPKALNALDLEMVRALAPVYESLEPRDTVVMYGSGDKAFCAGGDIRAIYEEGKESLKRGPLSQSFFREEYQLNYKIGTMENRHVALLNGITMGGGVGLSVHGAVRVACPTSVFAMPETAIGFFCDVGGSHFLSHLGSLGMYLALTGARLKGVDLVEAGIATHYVEEGLMTIPGLLEQGEPLPVVLDKLSSEPENTDKMEALQKQVEATFSHDSVEEIVDALRADGSGWALKTLGMMDKMSPTSLKVVHRQLTRGVDMDLKQALIMEYDVAMAMMEKRDFYEGVRALLVDRDMAPVWDPQQLSEVSSDQVEAYFQPLPEDMRLKLD